ncbi:HVA22-like protein a [Olea europaea var. sylvestris]|nr:HVA22-like protein a [Olea europaea var. sylvestris]
MGAISTYLVDLMILSQYLSHHMPPNPYSLSYYAHSYTLFQLHLFLRKLKLFIVHLSLLNSSNKSTSLSVNLKMEGSEAGSFLKVLLKNTDVLAGPVVSLVYPLYASIRAIETKSRVDDQQWLTYWILYSMITIFELTFAKLIEWIPFWSYAKLIFTCWLVIPYFSGASHVYEHYVRPYLVTQQKTINIPNVSWKNIVSSKHDDILTAAEMYIEENGPEAFERIIHRVNRDTTSSSSHDHAFHDDDYKY